MPISEHPWLFNSSLIMTAIPGLIGIQLFANPNAAFEMLEFTRPTGAADQKLAESLVMFLASRDLAVSCSTLAAWYSGNRTALGLSMLAGGGMCILDGLIQRRQLGRGLGKHWTFVPVLVGIGGGLLGWFD